MKFLIIFLFPLSLIGQSISVSPTSFALWGAAPETMRASVDFDYVSFVMYHKLPGNEWVDKENNLYEGQFFGVFGQYKIEGDHWFVIPGAGIMNRPFPTDIGARVNFKIDVGFYFGRFGLSYSHMSNGFGIQNPNNIGIDHINLLFRF